MSTVYMIVAIGPDNVIGKGNGLAWHSKVDFHHFVTQTKGWPCIFGATTFYGLPKYPLKNRLNIVVNIDAPEVELVKDPDNQNGYWLQTNNINTALDLARNYDKVFICGGKSIYKYCLDNNLINAIYLTKISSPALYHDIEEHPDDYIRFPYSELQMLKGFTYVGNLDSVYYADHIVEPKESGLTCEIKEYRKFEVDTGK